MSDLVEVLQHLAAAGSVTEDALFQITLDVARERPDPQGWVRNFITQLHGRMDATEMADASAQSVSTYEAMRQRLDVLGRYLIEELGQKR